MTEDLNIIQPKWVTLIAGATAGLVVDTSLYPIDTIKSRLQSGKEFKISSGLLKNLYRGLPPVLIGSMPNAAVFFITYETTKNYLNGYGTLGQVAAASLGEVASCLVRVPYEVIKMRSQTLIGTQPSTNTSIFKAIVAREGYAGLYRGFASTVYRDLPFSALQYPIWEILKRYHHRKSGRPATAAESAYYGSIAGGTSAFLTNPLDVAKSRVMIATHNDPLASGKLLVAIKSIYREQGIKGLFAGVVPRVIWISVGAAIFLGSYEKAINVLSLHK